MTRSMPESTKQPLPSGPATLCFNKEEFMRPDFNVESFIVGCRRRVQLETLRDDLTLYLKILQNAMIELINKDYADFVNLSTNLVGMDKAISNIISPLENLKEEMMNVQGSLNEAIAAVEVKMRQHTQVRQKKTCLQRLMNIMQSVECMEKLLGISDSEQKPSLPTEQRSGQLIERVATEFNKLQFYVSKSRGLPLVDKIKPRITSITSTLQYSLEGHFLEGLETGDVTTLCQCLRIYATIDKMRHAETLFRKHIVTPFMEEVISEEFLSGHPQGLRGLYSTILDFIPQHCKNLQEVTSGSVSGGETVRGYDFLVNAVWPEIVANIENRLSSIFAPGNANIFHQKYTWSMEFVERFERLCVSQASVKRLRAHPAFNTFMSKWSLPVYFQIRFQEIAGTFETALGSPFIQVPSDKSSIGLYLHGSVALWEGLHQCWLPGVYLSPLCARFWKLSLQLLSRYTTWVKQVQQQVERTEAEDNGNDSTVTQQTDPARLVDPSRVVDTVGPPEEERGDPPVTITDVVYLVADVDVLVNHVPDFFQTSILPVVTALGPVKTSLLDGSVGESCYHLSQLLPAFGLHIMEQVSVQCCAPLKTVNDIPRLYRRTNREVPSKPSAYVATLVKPLESFLADHNQLISADNRNKWSLGIVDCISQQYLSVTADVLLSVKKMEESLKRLKRGKTSAQLGMSDDDKIRLQLHLDVEQLGIRLSALNIDTTRVEHYQQLRSTVENAKNSA